MKRLIIIRFWRYIFASFKANKIQRINNRNNKTKTTNCENSTYKSGEYRRSTWTIYAGRTITFLIQPIERQLKFIPVSTSVRLPFTFPTIRRNFSRPLLGNFEVSEFLCLAWIHKFEKPHSDETINIHMEHIIRCILYVACIIWKNMKHKRYMIYRISNYLFRNHFFMNVFLVLVFLKASTLMLARLGVSAPRTLKM